MEQAGNPGRYDDEIDLLELRAVCLTVTVFNIEQSVGNLYCPIKLKKFLILNIGFALGGMPGVLIAMVRNMRRNIRPATA